MVWISANTVAMLDGDSVRCFLARMALGRAVTSIPGQRDEDLAWWGVIGLEFFVWQPFFSR